MQGNQEGRRPHAVEIENRRSAEITGVEDVDCFNERTVALKTSAGEMLIGGEGLNLSMLDLEKGRVRIEGEIASLEYTGKNRAEKKGFFGRLFR